MGNLRGYGAAAVGGCSKKNAFGKFYFLCEELFFVFVKNVVFSCCNEVTKPRNARCGGILRPKKEKTCCDCALKGRLNIFIM